VLHCRLQAATVVDGPQVHPAAVHPSKGQVPCHATASVPSDLLEVLKVPMPGVWSQSPPTIYGDQLEMCITYTVPAASTTCNYSPVTNAAAVDSASRDGSTGRGTSMQNTWNTQYRPPPTRTHGNLSSHGVLSSCSRAKFRNSGRT
jgi:hypothetical protein